MNSTDKAKAFVKETEKKIEDYRRFIRKELPSILGKNEHGGKRPGEFVGSSFLYIRSFDADRGDRDFSHEPFWLSPDLQVSPISNLDAYTRTLQVGQTYNIKCTVRNAGDLFVPSAKVEFYIANPSLHFDTRFATQIGVTSGWVDSQGAAEQNLTFRVPQNLDGHKCLFARVFSFSPLDLPMDHYTLNPRVDRHVAQLNLNFLKFSQLSSPYTFNWIHTINATETIEFQPMTSDEMRNLRHPFQADLKIRKRFDWDNVINNFKIVPTDEELGRFDMRKRGNKVFVSTKDQRGFSIARQKKTWDKMFTLIQNVNNGRDRFSSHKKLVREFREMNSQTARTTFQLKLPPRMKLRKKEAVGVHIVNRNRITNKVKGGVTLIIHE